MDQKTFAREQQTGVEDCSASIHESLGSSPIRVAIDLTALLPEATGVDNYLIRLVTHLSRIDQTNHYTLFVNYEDLDLFRGWPTSNFTTIPFCLRPRPVRLARAVWSRTPSATGVANPRNEGGAVCDELCV